MTSLESVPEASASSRRAWTFAQKGIVVVATAQLAWSLAGLIAEPSFSTGPDAATERVLWVDFNGWHALSGLLLFGPAFLAALRPTWARLYALYAGGLLVVTGVWALFSTEPAAVLSFPNNEADAALHLVTAALFLAVAAVQMRRDRAG
jgi:hypothetical protein